MSVRRASRTVAAVLLCGGVLMANAAAEPPSAAEDHAVGTSASAGQLRGVTDCLPDALFSQPPKTADWYAGTSDVYLGYLRAERFVDVTGPVCDIHWWGLDLHYVTGEGWEECVDDDLLFEIKFYADDPNGPGDELCSYVVTPEKTVVGPVGSNRFLNYYSVPELEPCCDVSVGWVSVQDIDNDECSFLWMNSEVGDGWSWVDGGTADYDLSLCLTGGPSDFGACCDYQTGICEITLVDGCTGTYQEWLGAGTNCSQCSCEFWTPPSYEPEGEPDCYDEWVDTFNGGCNSTPPVFSSLPVCGASIVGTAGTYDLTDPNGIPQNHRDTDWFQVVTTNPQTTLTWRVFADFPLLIFIIDGTNGCGDYTILSSATAFECEPAMLSATVGPGTYWLWAGTRVYDGVPCGSIYLGELITDHAVPGDTDCDGDVDLTDLATLLSAYGSCVFDPGFNRRVDLDDDNCVTLTDLAVLLSNYGT
jgi:hypothetical protein